MMRVLFVDDEPNVLSGLRRILRTMRKEWDMEFLNSGQEALDAIEETPFDVVVSDMRMPGIDGAKLLSVVRQRLPGAVRIALSGETEQNMIYRCVQYAHQYLAKPCDAEVLVDAVRRACMLQDLLQDEQLATRINSMSSLPSLPEQYDRIMEELQSEDASLQTIGEIIESDVAMTAKILQLVNSAFFGLSQHVSSPAQAAMLLGVDVLRTLVLTTGVFSQFDETVSDAFDLKSIWSRSAQVGALAKTIALFETKDKLIADYAFMAGMLTDVGQFVLAANMTDELSDAWRTAQESGEPDWIVERQVFGQCHMQIGAYLVGLWGLPNPIIEAVAYHHSPSSYSSTDFGPLTAVHAAVALVSGRGVAAAGGLDNDYLDALGLSDRLPNWTELYAGQCGESEAN